MDTTQPIMLSDKLYFFNRDGFDSAIEKFRITQRDEYSAEFLHDNTKYLVVAARISSDTKSIKAIAAVVYSCYPDISPISNLELSQLMRRMRDDANSFSKDSDYRYYLSTRRIFAQLGLCGVAATDYKKEPTGIMFRGTDFVDRREPQIDDTFSSRDGVMKWGWHNDVGIIFKII